MQLIDTIQLEISHVNYDCSKKDMGWVESRTNTNVKTNRRSSKDIYATKFYWQPDQMVGSMTRNGQGFGFPPKEMNAGRIPAISDRPVSQQKFMNFRQIWQN